MIHEVIQQSDGLVNIKVSVVPYSRNEEEDAVNDNINEAA